MSLKSKRLSGQASSAAPEQHLFLKASGSSASAREYVPRIYFEAKIDFSDVRSGLHRSYNVNMALEIYPLEGDTLWTRDMVWRVDPKRVVATAPKLAKLAALPDYLNDELFARIETQILLYLLRYYEVRILRNFDLNMYSGPDENLEDFKSRCVESVQAAFRKDLDILQEIYQRKLSRIKEKCADHHVTAELDSPRAASLMKEQLHDASERITELFLRMEFALDTSPENLLQSPPADGDRWSGLLSIEMEACQAIQRLLSSYQEKVCNIDEYVARPNLNDIHIVRTGILWMPGQVHRCVS